MSNKIIIDDEVYEKIEVIMDVISEYLEDQYVSIVCMTISSLLNERYEDFCFETLNFDDGSYSGDVYVTKEIFKMSKEDLKDPSLYEYEKLDDDNRHILNVYLNKSKKILKEI